MNTRRRDLAQWLPEALAGLALAVAVLAWLREPGGTAPPAAGAPQNVAASGEDAVELRRQLTALQERMARLENSAPRIEVLDQTRIEEMIATALASRTGGDASPTVAKAVPATAAAGAAARLLQELAQAPPGPQRDELWQQLRELGGIDLAVAHFERLAASQPQSADAQTDLGCAYVQKMLQTQDENQRVELGKKIDAQFDQALTLQPDHWEARFRKAVGLTYGPALSGRQTEAIVHFETLVRQQADRPATPQLAQTYLYLGRLYAQRGDAQKAQQIWQLGLARHPQDAELQRANDR